MAATAQQRDFDGTVRTARIIAIALALGVAIFLAIVAGLVRRGRLFDAQPWSMSSALISLIACAYGVVTIATAPLLARAVSDAALRRLAKAAPDETDNHSLAKLFLNRMIIGSALIEGAAFFCAIAFMIEGKAPAFIVALIGVVALMLRIPSRAGIESWIDEQRGPLREAKNSA